jgi:hypothetical protein
MKPNYDVLDYWNIQAYWGPRRETPAQIAARFYRMIEGFRAIDPVLVEWRVRIGTSAIPLPSRSSDELAQIVADHVDTADDGEPIPIYGYAFDAMQLPPADISLTINVHAGSYAPGRYGLANSVSMQTLPPNPQNVRLVTFPIFKSVLLALASAWDATWCGAYPTDVMPLWERPVPGGLFKRIVWIMYLSPRFARMVTPPRSAIIEYTPQGGIVMAATKKPFDASNQDHLAVAYDIRDALAPLAALPWPPDAEPAA